MLVSTTLYEKYTHTHLGSERERDRSIDIMTVIVQSFCTHTQIAYMCVFKKQTYTSERTSDRLLSGQGHYTFLLLPLSMRFPMVAHRRRRHQDVDFSSCSATTTTSILPSHLNLRYPPFPLSQPAIIIIVIITILCKQ